jgi:hypothetical protein
MIADCGPIVAGSVLLCTRDNPAARGRIYHPGSRQGEDRDAFAVRYSRLCEGTDGRGHAQSAVDQASAANRPEDAATVADLERLKERIDAATLSAASDLKRFQLLTLAGIWMLCATILLLHFARQ